MSGAPDLTKLVPGFEFLQNLMKGAGASIPGMSQWIAPTLDPEEIDKRIQELKTVQFWLEQNARLLATTIQALEVQRMTLSTLQTMNLPMSELRDALTARPSAATPPPSSPPAPVRRPEPPPSPPAAPEPAPTPAPAAGKAAAPAPAARAAAPAVDPMQWWAALTQQFTDIAAQALKDSTTPADPARASKPATAGAPPRKKAPARKRAAG